MDLGSAFSSAYEVETDPEFPGDGDWGCLVCSYKADGTITQDFESRWGAPTILRVLPASAPSWVGMFPAGGLGGESGVFGCPSLNHMCVVANGAAYLVDVTTPHGGAAMVRPDTHQVLPVPHAPLLLLAGFQDLVAVGIEGVAWRSPRLVLDELWVEQALENHLVCRGHEMRGTVTFEVDLATGERVDLIPRR
jgi:hypothetical protein